MRILKILLISGPLCKIYRTKDGQFTTGSSDENSAVSTVPWTGAQQYCKWLQEKTGMRFRLATEAEWEYVARGEFSEHNDNRFEEQSTCTTNDGLKVSVGRPIVVGMLGSVGEWVSDFYWPHYDDDDVFDPKGPNTEYTVGKSGYGHVLRRSAKSPDPRDRSPSGRTQSAIYSFRVVMEISKTEKEE